MTMFDELTGVTGRVLDAAGSGVVRIGRAEGRGAGVVLGTGLVVTSAHNLRGEETTVTFADGRAVTATVKGVDPDGDLAVLSLDTGDATALSWADAAPTAPGAPVFALGLPTGGGGVRVTFGTISSVGRSFRGPRWPPHHRRGRAHRSARPRFVGWPVGGHRRAPGRHQHPPAR